MQIYKVRIFIILLLLMLAFSCENTQIVDFTSLETKDSVTYYLNEKPFCGVIVEKYENNNLKYEKEYQNGKQKGTITFWYKNGNIQSKGLYLNNNLTGIFRSWYKNGNLKEEYISVNNKVLGKKIVFWENGKTKDESHYINGYIDFSKVQKHWYENGQIMQEFIPHSNKFGLTSIGWNEDGQKSSELIFTDTTSLFFMWDRDGKKYEFSFEDYLEFCKENGLDFTNMPTQFD